MSDKKGSVQAKKPEEKKVSVDNEFKNKYLRALADYQNLEKRMIEERRFIVQNANRNFILKLLPLLDSLDKAEVFVKDQGLKIAKDQFVQILKDAGLTELDVMNKPYDPYTAEVIDIEKGDVDNQVCEILRKGYQFNGQILRVAQVKVSKKITS